MDKSDQRRLALDRIQQNRLAVLIDQRHGGKVINLRRRAFHAESRGSRECGGASFSARRKSEDDRSEQGRREDSRRGVATGTRKGNCAIKRNQQEIIRSSEILDR